MKRFLNPVFLILALLIFCMSLSVAFSTDSINEEKVKLKINPLLLSEEFEYEIIKISELVNDLYVVAVKPPYRDFPNIFIFTNDQKDGYIRVYEGLCVGIQDEPSDKTDLHTLGLGIDMQINENGPNVFDDDKVRKMIELGNKNGFVVVPYQYFIHMQGNHSEFYTIDKTRYYDFAVKLLGDSYKKYPKDSCVMYDTPDLTDLQFNYENGEYRITATTDNNQLWIVSFDGIDNNNKYLVNKKIEVKNVGAD